MKEILGLFTMQEIIIFGAEIVLLLIIMVTTMIFARRIRKLEKSIRKITEGVEEYLAAVMEEDGDEGVWANASEKARSKASDKARANASERSREKYSEKDRQEERRREELNGYFEEESLKERFRKRAEEMDEEEKTELLTTVLQEIFP